MQEALDSVKAQTYKNLEVIISDDDSKDKTLDICRKFQLEVDFPVFIYHHTPAGIGSNWNNCVQNANGEYIKFLFQDDILEAICIEEQVALLKKTKAVAACCKRTIIDSSSKVITHSDWVSKYGDLQKTIDFKNRNFYVFGKKDLQKLTGLHYNIFGEPDTFLYHKSLFVKIGTFNENYRQILDLEYSYRILTKFPIVIQNKKLIRFRLHENQASAHNRGLLLAENNELQAFVMENFFIYLPLHMKKEYWVKKYRLFKILYQFKAKS